ncbi:host specificity protein J, partial [Vibrio metschnikovii]|nr:host specificity protein J [Vibrio metschnikovii]
MIKIEQRKGGFKVVGSGGGGKGKQSSRTPVESPDSLHNTSYAAILDVISNGGVVGPLHPDQPLRDIYLDGTPIQNEDGSLNFNRVETDYRVGTIDQEHIAGFPASVNVVPVGTEIKTTTPWVQQITGSELSAVRVSVNVPTLLKTLDSGKKAGDRVGYKVNYAIDLAIGGGSFENVVNASFDGKTVNGYTRTHRIDLPEGNTWRVRVRRLTPEASSTTIQDAIYVNSYAEVIDGKFRHPMTALIGLKIDAEQFQSIPTRAYHWKGRIIRVPSNYDPENRTYSGTWDGSFKSAYSNNPAWVFFDMLTNNLYGLGEYINVTTVDRYALYQIAAYCDQMVDNGMGGLEPRFVCNCFIQSAQDAMRVINDLSSVFRGMAYYADSQVVPVADMPSDPVYTYTNANVIDGLFEYSGSDLNTRKTVALVSYNDPDNFYKSKVEVVEDSDGIARYGIRKTEVIAFGCSSRGQAQRVGLYLLYTSRMETGGVAFSVGLDGVIPQPGSIIKVADRNRAGRHIGGRIRSAEIDAIVADRDHPAKVGDNLTVNLPSGKSETRAISAIDERKITVFPSFSELPASQSVWAIDADDLVTQQARVIAVQESDDITFGVSCVFHHPGKFAAIDSGVRLDPLPVSVVPPRTQTAPSNIEINQFHTFHQGTTRHVAEVSWDAPENAVLYDVQWRRDNGDWIQTPRTGTRLVQIEDIFSGTYTVRVRAINSLDVPSLWTTSEATVLDGEAGEPPVLSSLTTKSEVMAIRLDWSYPNTPNIISNVEIRASLNNQFQSSYALTSVAYPSTTYTVYGLGNGVEMWFWARLVDKNGLAGEWLPLSTGAGAYGKSSTDARDILDYLAGQIGSGELAPGLIEEIKSDVAAGIIDDVDNKLSDI